MKEIREPVLIVFLVILSWVLKEAIHLDAIFLAAGGALLLAFYALHVFIQNKQGKNVQKQFPWLYSVSGKFGSKQLLTDIEALASPNSTIFLLTPDLHNDARNPETKDIVLKNLREKNITYKYITKSDEEASINTTELLNNFSKYDKQIEVYVLNEVFGSMPTANVLLLSADATGRFRVFIELPVYESENSRTRRWWIEPDPLIANHWRRVVLEMLKGRTPIENPFAKRNAMAL